MSDVTFVKYCPLCGAENPRQQAFCLKCFDGDLSTVPVEPQRITPDTAAPVAGTPAPKACIPEEEADTAILAASCCLELVDNPAKRFQVVAGQTVGRTNKADVVLTGVPQLDWISGVHARFFTRGAQWYVQHVGGTNFIKVDGETYRGTEEVAIYDGSVVVLSLTAFRVTLGG